MITFTSHGYRRHHQLETEAKAFSMVAAKGVRAVSRFGSQSVMTYDSSECRYLFPKLVSELSDRHVHPGSSTLAVAHLSCRSMPLWNYASKTGIFGPANSGTVGLRK